MTQAGEKGSKTVNLTRCDLMPGMASTEEFETNKPKIGLCPFLDE